MASNFVSTWFVLRAQLATIRTVIADLEALHIACRAYLVCKGIREAIIAAKRREREIVEECNRLGVSIN